MTKLRGLIVALVIVGSMASCGSGDTDGDGAATTGSTTTSGSGEVTFVRTYFVRGEKVAASGRNVVGPGVARAAVEEVLVGPLGDDTRAGLITLVPEGTELIDLDIADGTATVDLSNEFTTGGGSLAMQLRVAQIVFTLTQFDTVERVDFLIDGAMVDGIGGEGLPTSYEGRGAFDDVMPRILVETPIPAAMVSSPITIDGMAATTVGTISYRVTDDERVTVAEGSTTANSGDGTWGTFSVTADVGDARGAAVVTVWEFDDDGERTNIYEVPLSIG